MAKGGHTRSGPAPDPNALRRDRDQGEWTILPAEGRPGDLPPWPLTKASAREGQFWRTLWRKPQAVVWERLGLDCEVALYVRRLAEAEESDSPVALSTLVRQLADSLGLTVPGLRANRWRIVADEVAAKRSERRTAEPQPSVRDRLKAIAGGGA